MEVSLSQREEQLQRLPIRKIVGILEYTRLARVGHHEEERFSFVHGRFFEFFVARDMTSKPNKILLNGIPSDSQWRDALVMYCEVTSERNAVEVADFCWSEIQEFRNGGHAIGSPQHMRAVHSLRLLRDGFRSRPECLAHVNADLSGFIEEEAAGNHGLLSAKIALEATGLLKEGQIERVVTTALKLEDEWISRTALRACRDIGRTNPDTETRFRAFIGSIPVFEYIKDFKELQFSLSLSDSFSTLPTYCEARRISDHFLIISTITLAVTHTAAPAASATLITYVHIIKLLSTMRPKKKKTYLPLIKTPKQRNPSAPTSVKWMNE